MTKVSLVLVAVVGLVSIAAAGDIDGKIVGWSRVFLLRSTRR